jgi:predicted enzyme related to lactoylglutathione lyase
MPVAGICHARGPNAGMPAQWMIYIQVDDLDACVQRCAERGGTVVDGPRELGEHRFCVIQDPAGAVAALIA